MQAQVLHQHDNVCFSQHLATASFPQEDFQHLQPWASLICRCHRFSSSPTRDYFSKHCGCLGGTSIKGQRIAQTTRVSCGACLLLTWKILSRTRLCWAQGSSRSCSWTSSAIGESHTAYAGRKGCCCKTSNRVLTYSWHGNKSAELSSALSSSASKAQSCHV